MVGTATEPSVDVVYKDVYEQVPGPSTTTVQAPASSLSSYRRLSEMTPTTTTATTPKTTGTTTRTTTTEARGTPTSMTDAANVSDPRRGPRRSVGVRAARKRHAAAGRPSCRRRRGVAATFEMVAVMAAEPAPSADAYGRRRRGPGPIAPSRTVVIVRRHVTTASGSQLITQHAVSGTGAGRAQSPAPDTATKGS